MKNFILLILLLTGSWCVALRAADQDGDQVSLIQHQWSYEVIDQIELIQGDDTYAVASNVLIDIETRGNQTVLFLRADTPRGLSKESDPSVNVVSSADGLEATLPSRRLSVVFEPSERGPVSATGVEESLRVFLEGVLSQGPAANVLVSGAAIPYAIQMDNDGQEVLLQAEQENGELWVDLTFGVGADAGAALGGQGWQLPIELALKEQTPVESVTVAGATTIRYSSVQVGPDNETTISIRLTTPSVSLQRQITLRPLPEVSRNPLQDDQIEFFERDEATQKLSAWTTAVGLSQSGVQRLAGLREVGLAAWVAQVSTDSHLTTVLAENEAALAALQTLERELPELVAPPRGTVPASEYEQVTGEKEALEQALAEKEQELAEARGEDWSWELQAAFAALSGDSNSDPGSAAGDDSAAEIFAPRAWIAYLWGEDNWRYGFGVGGAGISASSPAASHSWLFGSAFARGAYHGDSWNAGLNVGVETGLYDVSVPGIEANGMEGFYTGAFDGSFLLTDSWGITGLFSFGTAANGSLIRGSAGASYHLSSATAFMFSVEYLALQFDVDGQSSDVSGVGLGLGTVTRF